VGASGEAVAAVVPALFHGLKVHVKVQDGIDVDEVCRPTGNLVTRAVCELLTLRELAGRHGSFGSGVVAKRDRPTLTCKEILRFHQYVRPRWAILSRRECVECEAFIIGKFTEIRIGAVTAAWRSQTSRARQLR